jgi:hypothetical protein
MHTKCSVGNLGVAAMSIDTTFTLGEFPDLGVIKGPIED